MLTYILWTLVFLVGIAVLNLCCPRFKALEKAGFAMPVGIGLLSVYMFLADLLGMPINSVWVNLGGLLAMWLILLGFYYRQPKNRSFNPALWFEPLKKPSKNLAFYLILIVGAYVLYMISARAMFWPIANYDSVAGYDLLGKITFFEGTLNNSVFDKLNSLENNRTGYTPLYPLSLTFAYVSGVINAKITSVFLYVSLAASFFVLLRQYVTPLASALFALILITIPEYAFFSSLSSNNPPLAYYAGLGIVSIYIWYDKGDRGFFNLGCILLALGMWTRNESIFFALPAMGLTLLHGWPKKRFRDLAIISAWSLLPLVIWQITLKYVLYAHVKIEVRTSLFFDWERIRVMGDQISQVSFSTFYYGIVVFLFCGMVLVSLVYWLIKRHNEHWMFLACIGAAWIMYIVLFYQMDVDFTKVGWLLYSYKRGLFTYFPPIVFFIAITQLSQRLFNGYLGGDKMNAR